MPRKQIYTKEKIIDRAYDYLRKEGLKNFDARNLSKEIGMSTMPIYSYFESMDFLLQEVQNKAKGLLIKYQMTNYTGMNFLDMGIGYIKFALEETNLFRLLFLEEKSLQQHWEELIESLFDLCIKEMKKVPFLEGKSDQQLKELTFDIWVYTHGLASLLSAKVIKPIGEEDLVDLLQGIARGLLTRLE